MKAPVIVKWRYWNNRESKSARAANYLNYIGTREGVEKPDDNWMAKKATAKQKEIIAMLLRDAPSIRNMGEYEAYEKFGTRGYASELISGALDDHPALLDKKTYLDYIATRPRTERFGSHGLFSDDGKPLVMSEERERINSFDGRINTLIISLSREDAEACGFNSAERWRAFMRTQKTELSKRFGIPLDSLQWYGAFHNESYHPHIHVLLYSTDPRYPGYISKQGLEGLKSTLAAEIFKNELTDIYREQTKRRDVLTKIARDEITELVMSLQSGVQQNPELIKKLTELSEKLRETKGKKVYGYLPPKLKGLVNEITDMLTEDERIKRLYDLWYESKYAILKTYTAHLPDQLPLSQEPTFKPIKNSIIKEAMRIGSEIHDVQDESDEAADTNNPSTASSSDSSKNNPASGNRYENHNSYAHTNTQQNTSVTKIKLSALTRLGKDISNTFRERIDEQLRLHPEIGIDSRLKREIEAKKKGQNISM